MLSLLYLGVPLGVKARQSFVSSSCLFLDKKTLLQIWFNSGLDVTNFRGTGPYFPPIWPHANTQRPLILSAGHSPTSTRGVYLTTALNKRKLYLVKSPVWKVFKRRGRLELVHTFGLVCASKALKPGSY